MLFEMTMKKIKLFDYQEDMVKRVQEAFKHHDAVMVQMPTGTGKTMVLANIVFSFLEKGNHPIWIVAHRRELVEQIKETLNKSLLIFSNHPVPLSKEGLSKITPSLFTIKEGSTSHPGPLTLRGEGENRPTRCSEPLRSKVGGPSKVSPDCAGWDRLTDTCLRPADGLGEGLGATSASSVNPASDMMPIKVMSIQWLSKHYREMEEEPGLIVIDEAHHALAETYAEVMNAYPKAKKLGLTATPYRLNGKGFTDLFDTLLCSWSMEKFIAEGRLSLYDYYSIKPDSADQLLIDSLQKRGADGDYQQKELNEVMDVRPSLERLCLSIKEYVKGKKGIVYAISIQHAEHIAEYYRKNGIKAVAISSKTPSSLRKELIERFKSSNTSQNLSFSERTVESSKITPSLLYKDLSNHPVKSSKITPSLFTIKEGSTSHPDPLTLRGEGGNRPTRCSEPLRSKDGGPSKVSPDCAGWDRRDAIEDTSSASGSSASDSSTAVTSSVSTALNVVQRELKYLGLWKFAGAVMYVLHEALGLSEEKMIAPMDEKRGRLLLAEILDGGNFGRHFTKYAGFTHQSMGKKYFLKIWRNMHFMRYYPAEALSEPIFRTWHFFWRMKNKK